MAPIILRCEGDRAQTTFRTGSCQMTGNPEVETPRLRLKCRGRDDHHWSPPAQIRTGAFTQTALTVEEWRRNALLAAHRAIPGTCVPRSVSGTCVIERCSPQSVPFPPQPPPKAYSSLFGWFTGTTAQSDFSCTCVSAVRFMAFADRS